MIDDLHFMRIALRLAEQALSEGEVPVGAIVVFNDVIIAKAYNQVERLTDVTAHAEVLAITSAANYLGAKYLKDCSLYVSLEPCLMCGGAMFWSQLGKLVYGASDEKRGFSSHSDRVLHPKTQIVGGLLAEESGDLLKAFFRSKR